MILTQEQFVNLTRPLVGLPVSLPWQGHGSAVFFELGELQLVETKRSNYQEGVACIAVEWDWRVEGGKRVLFGSSNSRPRIAAGIRSLQGVTIDSLDITGAIPELVIRFSNGVYLKSMVMVTGYPEWSIRTIDGEYIHAHNGDLQRGSDGAASLSAEEEAAFALAEQTAIRWGVPSSEPLSGQCRACLSFIPLDGEGQLLDYGCCVSERSPFDGRAVARASGCSAFSKSS